MSAFNRSAFVALAIGLALLGTLKTQAEEPSAHGDVVRIGLIGSLFRDVPSGAVAAMMEPFGAMMQSQTGITGELVPSGDANQLGQMLAEDKVQLAVFHGIEFAWARVKYPQLRPLVIAVNRERYLHAILVARAEGPVNSFADLQGKALALPRGSREHAYLFLQHNCQELKKDQQHFFSKITQPANIEAGLDDVVDRLVQAAIVDNVSLDCYKRRKPGRFEKLKIVQTSEVFPAAVVAYRLGALDEPTLKRFREGMANANQTLLGRQLLTLWKLTAFEAVPDDYEQTCTEIVRAYPPPACNGK
jgi:ABC-type phosphate/phosphonate transport system substrate-binding protein